ncbi:hypothetical protein Bca4012_010775 [Brassica carinata]
MTPRLLVVSYIVQECGLARFDCCYVIDAPPTHYAVSSINGSSQSQRYDLPTPFLVAVTTVQECGHVRSSHYYANVASPSQYDVSSIASSSQSRFNDPSVIFLVARTTVQECRVARAVRFYVTAATPAHYTVSSVDGSSQSWLGDPLTRDTIFYGVSQTSRFQNQLVGYFNVVFDFFFAFLMQFTVENLSGCNQLSPLDL